MKKDMIFIYLERLCNILRNQMRHEGSNHALQPVQLEALYYLSVCNQYSNTPKGVTEYLGQTKGTVSQSLKILEKKGFIIKSYDINDKRITHLHITQSGQQALEFSIPPAVFKNLADMLDEKEQEKISSTLKSLLSHIQSANKMKTFGVCKLCRYFYNEIDGTFMCELTKEKLTKDEANLICLEHEYEQI
jgi:DNA-binding MarR family transcriptional regulator